MVEKLRANTDSKEETSVKVGLFLLILKIMIKGCMFAVSFTYFKRDADWWRETMKKVEDYKFLSGSFVEDRISEAFKKNY